VKKIVHIGKYYFPKLGGIETVTKVLARGAADHGYNVSVVSFNSKAESVFEQADGVMLFRAPLIGTVASQPLGFTYCRCAINEMRKADVVHLHLPNMVGALCSLFIPKHVKLLLHWHSDVINKGLLGFIFRPLEALLLRRADSIIATSAVYAENSISLNPFLNKVIIVPIGISDVALTQHDNASKQALPKILADKISGKKLILAVGRLVPYKGFDFLVEASKMLEEDAIVVIVGDGPMRDTLQNLIYKIGVSDSVYLAGRLDDEVLQALFLQSEFFCLPSTNKAEAFGVVLIEAMAYGLPIVSTNIVGSGISWVNKHNVSGLNISVGDADALASACNQILQSKELRQRLSKGSRDRFVNNFTEKIFVEKVLEIYDSLTITRHSQG
jgi:glycosyltransferase involved in cell wall biosynthesis